MIQTPHQVLDAHHQSPRFQGRCALAVMAKVPHAGRVKTRLSPPLNPKQAAALNIAFLKDTVACLEQVSTALPADPVVSFTPRNEEASLQKILPNRVVLVPQRGETFGERLLSTAEDLFGAGFSAVCLIDSDSPTVPPEVYAEAVRRLLKEKDCAVLGPSDDGGYYLLGFNSLQPRLFEGIAWSTKIVAEQTCERARELRLPMYPLPNWFDVDDREALLRLYRELIIFEPDRKAFRAPHTRQFLRKVGKQLGEDLLAAAQV
jgi:uncharacterized protein